jgi:hypothetical protein
MWYGQKEKRIVLRQGKEIEISSRIRAKKPLCLNDCWPAKVSATVPQELTVTTIAYDMICMSATATLLGNGKLV